MPEKYPDLAGLRPEANPGNTNPSFLEEGLTAGRVVSWVWYIPQNLFRSSTSFARLFNITPKELEEGLPLSSIVEGIHKEDAERVENSIRKAIETGERYAQDYRVRTANGNIHWVSARGIVEYDEEGNPQRFPGVIIDITERKEAEQKLEQVTAEIERQRRLYEAILSSTPDMAFVFDLDYRIKYANEAILEMWGLSYEEALGKKMTEIGYEPWYAQKHTEEIEQVISRKMPVRGEGSFPHATLGERCYDYILVPILNDKDKVEAIAGTIRDITEHEQVKKDLKNLNETLEKRVEKRTRSLITKQRQLRSLTAQLIKAEEQERRRLAAKLHDNLGQMLAVARMKTDLLQQEVPSGQTASRVEGLKQLVDDAVSFTRNMMSDLMPPPTLDKEDVCATVKWVAKKMKKHDLKVAVHCEDDVLRVDEPVRNTLLQAVRELLFNVIKHAGVDEARVDISHSDTNAEIVIEDKGEGFDPEGPETMKQEDGGGFGLFSIRERMDMAGGTMEIDSAPGRGTRVTLLAPLQEEKPSVTEEKETPGRPAGEHDESDTRQNVNIRRKVRVMLVDDHKMMRDGLRKIVAEQNDMKVIAEASDGKEAVELVQETSPDIVVMDVSMPGMDGAEATRHITSGEPNLRVIGLSLHEDASVIDRMRKAGATAYLTKSDAYETLCATIRSEAAMVI